MFVQVSRWLSVREDLQDLTLLFVTKCMNNKSNKLMKILICIIVMYLSNILKQYLLKYIKIYINEKKLKI